MLRRAGSRRQRTIPSEHPASSSLMLRPDRMPCRGPSRHSGTLKNRESYSSQQITPTFRYHPGSVPRTGITIKQFVLDGRIFKRRPNNHVHNCGFCCVQKIFCKGPDPAVLESILRKASLAVTASSSPSRWEIPEWTESASFRRQTFPLCCHGQSSDFTVTECNNEFGSSENFSA